MKRGATWLVLLTCASGMASAQLQVLPDSQPRRMFGGAPQKISVCWQNRGSQQTDSTIRIRIFQSSSATAAPISEQPWKQLALLPGQMVLESAQLDFPAVRGETKFVVQWIESSNRVCGVTELRVYPTNLLAELKSLFGEAKTGVLDPNNELKPALKQNGLEFVDLNNMALDDFSGRLAIVGPFESKAQIREGLRQTIQKIARKGAAVVWLLPPAESADEITPSFYVVQEGKGTVVVVQPALVTDFSADPRSQLNLIYFCKLALNAAPLALPDFSLQP